MAKRFIDTDIFKKKSIRGLDAPYKLLYIYIITDCSHAGIWEVNLDVAELKLGFKFPEKETVRKMGDTITVFDDGSKWYINSFIEFQYGELNPQNRAHKSVLDQLGKYFEIQENKPLISPIKGYKDMDKDMELDKDMDKVKEEKPKKEKVEIVYPFTSPEFLTQWQIWKDYKNKEHGFKYKTPQTEQAALMQLATLSGNDEQKAIQIIHQSLANGWKGFFELKNLTNGISTQGNNGMANRNQINFTAEHLRMGEHSKYRKNPTE